MRSKKTVQFYFDYYSPYAYLANTLLPKKLFRVEYCPVSVAELMGLVQNVLTPKCPAKFAYMLSDTARLARHYSVPLQLNEQWWSALQSNTVSMRLYACGALAAQQLGHFEAYQNALFDAIWAHPRDVVSEEGRVALLLEAGVPAYDVWNLARSREMEAKLDERNAAAAAVGVFGVPFFIVDDEKFFGTDRLDFLIQHAVQVSRPRVGT
jgi:2-hydroxychromene-2-carboxylate isomerase